MSACRCEDAHLAVYLTGRNPKSEYFDNYILLCNNERIEDEEEEEEEGIEQEQQDQHNQDQGKEEATEDEERDHIYHHPSTELLTYESNIPRIVLVFKTGDDSILSNEPDGHGFLAHVRFLTGIEDCRIPIRGHSLPFFLSLFCLLRSPISFSHPTAFSCSLFLFLFALSDQTLHAGIRREDAD